MATTYDPLKLTPGEEETDPSIIGSMVAGLATGLIRIPEGAVSLAASLFDLTADTDTATEVEQWFDENIYKKLGNLEEKAESTTAGKITAALVNIGVPGGIAFKYGTKMAEKALRAANNGKYLSLANPYALFTAFSGVEAFNFSGNIAWIRFYYEKDPANTGTIDKILYRH